MTTLGPVTTCHPANTYIDALFAPDDIVEIRALDRRSGRRPVQYWKPASTFTDLLPEAQRLNDNGYDIFVGVNPRPRSGATGDASISRARCVFVDFDGGISLNDIRTRLATYGLPEPSIIVFSGHGWHCYWILSEPITDLKSWSGIQSDLIAALDSDKCIKNPERIMRVPGFANNKNADAVISSELFECDTSHVYELADIVDRLPIKEDAAPAAPLADDTNADIFTARLDDLAQELGIDPGSTANTSGPSVIDAFNDAYDVDRLLVSLSYTHLFNRGSDRFYRRPGKTDPGVSVIVRDQPKQRSYHFSSEDRLNDGRFGNGTVGVHDCFSLYCQAHHGGDQKAAIKAAAKELGISSTAPAAATTPSTAPTAKPSDKKPGVPAAPVDEPLLLPSNTTLATLIDACPNLRPIVIDGLLRQGETMNVISAPKIGKSWLTHGLALSIAAGRPWLHTYDVVPGKVLLLDNELHPESLAARLHLIAARMGIPRSVYGDQIVVESLRGKLRDWAKLGPYFAAITPGEYRLIICDAFYRFMPKGSDENDNGTMAEVYNLIDRYADLTKSSFALIHHSSKGIQAGKAVTDVGAGAGAQSRATDSHLVLRHHEEDDVVVLDAAVRSFKPVEPICIRWEYPLWSPAPHLDPSQLRKENRPRRERIESSNAAPAIPATPPAEKWTRERFVERFVSDEGQDKAIIIGDAVEYGSMSKAAALDWFAGARAKSLIHEWIYADDRRRKTYARVAQPVLATGGQDAA